MYGYLSKFRMTNTRLMQLVKKIQLKIESPLLRKKEMVGRSYMVSVLNKEWFSTLYTVEYKFTFYWEIFSPLHNELIDKRRYNWTNAYHHLRSQGFESREFL